MLTKSYWKPLSPSAIFITMDNPNKRRDYEEQVAKVFYLSNVNGPQELQEIARGRAGDGSRAGRGGAHAVGARVRRPKFPGTSTHRQRL